MFALGSLLSDTPGRFVHTCRIGISAPPLAGTRYLSALSSPAGVSGIDPILGGTQTWKLSHWRFIKNDEKERENTLYVYRLSIPYNHLFVKKDHFLSVLLVFQSLLDSDIPKKNAFVFDC